jgi:alkylation response protein AidB-like acyl-CoA dehydrogenase
MDFALTDEQQDFVAAIRDFCARECGTQEQREKLTEGYELHHNFDIYKQMAELGWLGVTIPSSTGAPAARCSTPASSWKRPRAGSPRSAATRRR